MSETKVCCETVWQDHSRYPCGKRAKVERDGHWYCGIHDPVRRAEKHKARDEKWEKEWRERDEKWRHDRAATALCKSVTTEELEQLGAGWLRRHLDAMKEGE